MMAILLVLLYEISTVKKVLSVVFFLAIMVACPWVGMVLTDAYHPSGLTFFLGLVAVVLTPPVNVLAWYLTFGLWKSE